jgi:hypothetical protein
MNAPSRITNLYREETSYIKDVIHRCKIMLSEALRNDDSEGVMKQEHDIAMLQEELNNRKLKEIEQITLDFNND